MMVVVVVTEGEVPVVAVTVVAVAVVLVAWRDFRLRKILTLDMIAQHRRVERGSAEVCEYISDYISESARARN